MTERRPRVDAARNREAVLAAADRLFSRCASSDEVTMAAVATEAGVGKATLFRGYGDRTGLLRALWQAHLGPLWAEIDDGPPPLGPGTPPRRRVAALLDAMLCFKFDHRQLAAALESAGSGSPYGTEQYARAHRLVRDEIARLAVPGADFTAHALLSAVRADLVVHLAAQPGNDREALRDALAQLVATTLGAPPGADGERPAPSGAE
ncbi:TetR/AcrR family transcriptional regulator [Streptomyces lonarensis]|uniref:TetR/AcrR family transcriptional regulator n=1 Tax=Streptomyces lonarensis TaxID=700599 RepID=A0A7X6HX97_9ACTN|nr:TetR family transcriptional regulator [Streptomyces lonarensis]NJQ04331.1 TetR/AcrR family transcriptional regulator [Streptomyces lonarensis]